MRYVIDPIKKKEEEVLLEVVRMEIDYELLSLHDALEANNTEEVQLIKEKLIKLVNQLY